MIEETILTDSAIAYLIPGSFDAALQSVRRTLADDGLDVVAELHLSRYIERMLGVVMPDCTVLCVWPPTRLEEKLLADAPLAGLFPFHVVVSARGSHTEIHILGSFPEDALTPRTHAPVTAIQASLSRALDRIAMRRPAFSLS